MGTSYSEKLRDPRWQRLRLEIWARANSSCEACGSKTRTMDVHHCWYEKGNEPWEYPLNCFLLLCGPCHKRWHSQKLALDKSLGGLGPMDMDRVLGLVRGLVACTNQLDIYFGKDADMLTVAAAIRGFWPPARFQSAMIDSAMVRIGRRTTFWLSDLVSECIPFDEPEFAYMERWYEAATYRREAGDCA